MDEVEERDERKQPGKYRWEIALKKKIHEFL